MTILVPCGAISILILVFFNQIVCVVAGLPGLVTTESYLTDETPAILPSRLATEEPEDAVVDLLVELCVALVAGCFEVGADVLVFLAPPQLASSNADNMKTMATHKTDAFPFTLHLFALKSD